MASPGGQAPPPLIARILADPGAFEFVQAVRLCEQLLAQGPVGEDALPGTEAAHFRAEAALRFPVAEIAAAERPAEGPLALAVNFFGLTGPAGALPRFYTEHVVRALRRRNHALRDFLDVFHHRLIALFYRAAIKYRLPLRAERTQGGEESFSTAFAALIGMATPALAGRLPVADATLIYYAGHFSRWPRSAAALEAVLGDFFALPVAVSQFRGQWLQIAAAEQTRLPGAAVPDGQFCSLGQDAVLGARAWDMQGGFRIVVGPLSYAAFRGFMPGGDFYRRLIGLTRAFVGAGPSFDLQVTLSRDEVPSLCLGEGPRLA